MEFFFSWADKSWKMLELLPEPANMFCFYLMPFLEKVSIKLCIVEFAVHNFLFRKRTFWSHNIQRKQTNLGSNFEIENVQAFRGNIANIYEFCRTISGVHLQNTEPPQYTSVLGRQQLRSKKAYLLATNQKAAFT